MVGTSATATLVGETSGSDSAVNTNSGLSSEFVSLGQRYDDGEFSQAYDNDWDYIFVKKALATDPSASTPGSEEVGPGPVGYWSFDEGYGTTAYDNTAQDNDGTITGATWQDESMCVSGKCLQFDGTDDLVNVGDTNGEAKTLSFWMKPNSSSEDVIDLDGGTHSVTISNGTISANGFSSPDIFVDGVGATSIEANSWHHVTIRTDTAIDASNVQIAKVVTATSFPSTSILDDFNRSNEGPPPSSNWSSLYSGTVGALEVSSNQCVPDAATNNMAGNYWNVSSYTDNWEVYNKVVTVPLNASSEYGALAMIQTPGGVSYNGYELRYDDTSLSVWRQDSSSPTQLGASFSQSVSSGDSVGLSYSGGVLTAYYKSGAGSWTTLGTRSDSTYQATALYPTIYAHINNISEFAFDDFGGGAIVESADYFQGFIDEVKIYPHARSADQIKQDYNAGLAGQSSATGTAASFGDQSAAWMSDGLVGHWKMDEFSGTTVADSSGNGNAGTLTSAQEIGTAEAASTTTTVVDADNVDLTTTDDVYNNMWLNITGGTCGLSVGDKRKITDYVGSTKTLTMSGAFGSEPDDCTFEILHQTNGKFGSGVVVTDTERIQVADNDILDITDEITVAFWAKHDSYVSGINSYFSYKGSAYIMAAGWGLDTRFCPYIDGASRCSGSFYPPAELQTEWNHYVGTYSISDKTVRVYFNGEEMMSSTLSGLGTYQIDTNANDFYPFYSSENGRKIYIDESRLYNRALSDNEIRKLYEWAPRPVLHMTMDENTGTTAYDVSENSNDGAFGGAPAWDVGKFGSALKFDGVDDYLNCGSDSSIDGVNGLSYSVWVRRTEASTYQWPHIMMHGGGHSDYELRTGAFGDSVYFEYGLPPYDGSTFSSLNIGGTGNLPVDEWHHFAVSYDGSTLTSYRDGVQITQKTDIVLSPSFDYCRINNYSSTGFNGWIDDVKVYNYARTQKQIVEDMFARDGSNLGGDITPVAHYKFNEGYGDTANNVGFGGNNGTLTPGAGGTNTTTTAMWSGDGRFGKAIEIDGTDDYVEISYDSSLKLGDNGTISLWFKPGAVNSGTHNIISYGGSSYANGYLLNQYGTSLYVYWEGAGAAQVTLDNFFEVDTWHHIILVNDNGSMSVYKNGKLVTSGVASGGSITNNYSTYIGDVPDLVWAVTGVIDEVKIFNFALTSDEVATEFNAGSSSHLGEVGTESDGTTPTSSSSREYCVPGDTSTCNPPVGDWRLDENTGTTAYDISGNGNDGTLGGGTAQYRPSWAPGKVGQALQFDGIDDYVNAGSDASLDIVGDMTLEAWVKPSDTTGWEGLASKWGNSWAWSLDTVNHRSAFYIDGWRYSNTGIPANQWSHMAVVFDSTADTVYFYLDGKPDGSYTSQTVDQGTTGDLNIGAWGFNYYSESVIDDVKIYDYARTQEQIAWDFNRGKPVGHWKLNTGEGTTAFDSSGNGNNGTLTNMDPATDWISGKLNSALDFNLTNEHVIITDPGTNWDLDLTDAITVAAWIKPETNTGTVPVSKFNYGDNNRSWRFWYPSGNTIGFTVSSTGTTSDATVSSTSTLTPDGTTWYHVAATYNGSQLKMFVNGKEESSINYSSGIFAGAEDIAIGVNFDNANPTNDFDGSVDDVRIYSYALTPLQIKDVYNNGAVSFR